MFSAFIAASSSEGTGEYTSSRFAGEKALSSAVRNRSRSLSADADVAITIGIAGRSSAASVTVSPCFPLAPIDEASVCAANLNHVRTGAHGDIAEDRPMDLAIDHQHGLLVGGLNRHCGHRGQELKWIGLHILSAQGDWHFHFHEALTLQSQLVGAQRHVGDGQGSGDSGSRALGGPPLRHVSRNTSTSSGVVTTASEADVRSRAMVSTATSPGLTDTFCSNGV